MADELIDIFDSEMNFLGTAMKSQAHHEGLWHKAFHCWIVKPSKDGKHIVWLQLRGKDKDLYPNMLDISSAGHLAAGETAKQGIREIEEEIGLKVEPEKLVKLFTNIQNIMVENMINKEFNPTYVLKTDAKLENLKMQPEEVDGVYEAVIQDLLELVSGRKKHAKINGLYRNDDNSYKKEEKDITTGDMAPHGEKYYTKIFETLQRYCDGVTE
ncbi:MAG: NUDIX domain-containing protein [Lactobacillaceae bacterium]|jgi:isopentenyldiphosphate isomerase|nr:NUDIX domain-containing protein [Lactobacillaceae bacterium]